jgi:hypothetical protein
MQCGLHGERPNLPHIARQRQHDAPIAVGCFVKDLGL